MNDSSLAKVLLVLLALIALGSLIIFWRFNSTVKQFRDMQFQMNAANTRQQMFMVMVNELAEASKKSPSLEPLVRSITGGQAPAPGGSAAPKSPGK